MFVTYNQKTKPVTVERISFYIGKDDEYAKNLLFAYLSQQMIRLRATSDCDLKEISEALSLFGVRLRKGLVTYNAQIDFAVCCIKWCEQKSIISDKQLVDIIVTSSGVNILEHITENKMRHRRNYNELSPAIKEKIKNLHGWK